MSTTNLTMSTIEARALSAPGYMGLPQAKHIFLVSSDRQFGWPCFGRGYEAADPGALVNTAAIYKEWAFQFARPDAGDQYLGGVANTVNGTCHTIANRVLALSDTDNANVSNSVDDPYSVVVFGKYGFGTNQFCDLLIQSFAHIQSQYAVHGVPLETVLARVKSPFKDELAAWKIVLQQTMGIDVGQIVQSTPSLADQALSALKSYCEDRDAMYERCFDYREGRAPNGAEKEQVRNQLMCLALAHINQVLNALAISQLISPTQKNGLHNAIQNYINHAGF